MEDKEEEVKGWLSERWELERMIETFDNLLLFKFQPL